MQCPRCQTENPAHQKLCLKCAAPLARACVNCGTQLPSAAKFCSECAHPAAISAATERRYASPASYTPKHLAERILTSRSALEGERKQVTVLFADVAGFSTLSERLDPEAVHEIMDGCFEVLTRNVHQYEGTINQFTGDGIMALFGAPIAHEDHAVRALQAALDIQADLAGYAETVKRRWRVPFQMRIGINTGSVVVARIGDNLRTDYTAQGDTTNLAARLQQVAPPGAIWVGESAYRVARGAFEWRPIGPLTVKGREAPVGAYELLGRQALRSRFEAQVQRGLTRFVGRNAELQQLLAAWETTRQGQGRVVSVVGEAGLGKSRLLYELKEQLVEEGAQYLEGSCFAYGDSISYLPFLEIVKAFFALHGINTEADAKRQIAARLATLELEAGTVIPYLHNLLTYAVEDEMFFKLPPYLVRGRTVTALKTLILAVAGQQPLVLIVEDVHWIDKATEEVVGALVEALPSVPLLLLLGYRPEYLHAWATKAYHAQINLIRLAGASGAEMVRAILHKPYASRVALQRLTTEQSSALIHGVLGTAAIPPEVERFVVAKTEGNPFFVEELTLSLLESGELVPSDGGYVLQRSLDALSLPTTVQGVLLARIDRLTGELKSVLQVAAVIGRVFSHGVLAHAIGRGDDVDQALVQLEDLEFIYPTRLALQREYSFKHVLTQEAVYDSLLRPMREAIHERVGHAIEALYSDRLYHYVRSANMDRAVEYLHLANRKVAKANAIEKAKAYFDQAMQLLDTLPETESNQQRRISLLVNQSIVFQLLFKFPEYYDLLTRYEPIAVGLGDPGLLGALYASLGHCEYAFGDFDKVIRTGTKATELCEAAGNAEDAGFAYLLRQWSHLYKGDYHQALALKADVLRKMEQRFNLRWYAWAFAAASWAHSWLGRWDSAVEEGHKALRVAEEFSDDSLIGFAYMSISIAYTYKGDLGRAVEYAELALKKAPTPADKMWSQAYLAWAWCRAGEPRRGVEPLAQAVSINRSARFVPAELDFTLYLGEGYWLAGEPDKARQTLEKLLEIAERCGARFVIGSAHRLLGEIALSTNPTQVAPPLAAPHFERSIAILREINAENELALALAGHSRLQKQLGNITEAREYLTKAQDIFERLGTLIEPDKVRAELGAMPAS